MKSEPGFKRRAERMDVNEFLKREHREAMDMINQLATNACEPSAGDVHVFDKLKSTLQLLLQIEEIFLYPHLENFDETTDLVVKEYDRHRKMEELLNEMDPRNPNWRDQLIVLKCDMECHIEEEENAVIPRAELLLGEHILDALAREMEEMKKGGFARV